MKDPQSSWPFSQAELAIVLDACEEDGSEWVSGASKFLAWTGAHISVLSGGVRQAWIWDDRSARVGHEEYWQAPPIRSNAIRGDHIFWNRPKNQRSIGIPLSRHLKGWLEDWLDQPRPLTPRRYTQVFDRVGAKIGLQVNPLRFRHTFAVYLFHEVKLSAEDVCEMIGVTPETMQRYVIRPYWVRANLLAAANF